VLTLTVDNEAGTLARIAGMFTARGYNIDSLTVADISEDHAISRITIVTKGPPRSSTRSSHNANAWFQCTRLPTSPMQARMSNAS